MYLLTQTVQLTTKSIHFFIKTHCKNPTLLHKKKKRKEKTLKKLRTQVPQPDSWASVKTPQLTLHFMAEN